MDRSDQEIDHLEDRIHLVLDAHVPRQWDPSIHSGSSGGGGGSGAAPCSKAGVAVPDWLGGDQAWTIPDIVDGSDGDGLSDVAVETLSACLHPVLEGLAALDAEVLLGLRRRKPQPRQPLLRGGAGGDMDGPVVQEGVIVGPIHDEIEPPSHDSKAVRYLHLSEMDGQYSMGIFVFPPHARIPLHDHPGMCVLSRVLYGDVHRLQLDLDRDQPDPQQQPRPQPPQPSQPSEVDASSPLSVTKDGSLLQQQHNQLSQFSISNLFRGRITPPDALSKQSSSSASTSESSSPMPHETSAETQQRPPAPSSSLPSPPAPGAKRAFRRHVDHLRAPQTTILYPFEGNLHEFVAGPHGAAVLDVLLPPYDAHHHRDCTFYEIYDDDDISGDDIDGDDDGGHRPSGTNGVEEEDDDDDAMVTDDHDENSPSRRVPCWIVPTGQPEDFHCISGRYRNLGSE